MGYQVTVFSLVAIYLFGISRQDIRRHEISNFAPVVLILASPFISTTPTVERIVGLFGLFLPLMAVNFLTNGFGMGDVKLCAAFGWVLGAFTGYCSLAVALAVALTAAVVVGKITNNKLLPLAPFLSGAGMAAIIFREVLISC